MDSNDIREPDVEISGSDDQINEPVQYVDIADDVSESKADEPEFETAPEDTPEDAPEDATEDAPEEVPIKVDNGTQEQLKPSGNKKTAFGLIISLLPLLPGILSAIATFQSEPNGKYLSGTGSLLLTVAVAISLTVAIVGLLSFKSERSIEPIFRARAFSLIPELAALFLICHLAMNNIGEWGNTILIFCLAATAFFVFKGQSKVRPAFRIAGAVGMLLLCTSIIALLYLDFEIELNSPYKMAVQFGAVGMMLGTIADARATLSRIGAGWLVLLKSSASSLCLICAGLTLTAFARGTEVLPDIYFALSLLYLGYAISAIAETIAITATRRKPEA